MGDWTDIVQIVAPDNARAGELVSITARIKNLGDFGFFISATGIFDGTEFSFSPSYAGVDPGQTYPFSGSFIMPSHDVRVTVYSFFWTGTVWALDDEAYVDIALAEVFEGEISKKELEYDSSRASIPALNIPQGERGLVHIWGRNNMTTTQRMGIWWQVKDPDGVVVEEYSTWEAWPYTSPGSAHEFIGGRFNLDKAGTYTIAVQLFMNHADQVVVDDYYGNLCTVEAAVPEPEFRDFGVTEYSTV